MFAASQGLACQPYLSLRARQVLLRAARYGGQPSRGLPTAAHANVGKR